MSSKKLIIVDKDSAGTRLDKFLKEQLAVPFSLIQREIRKKNIKVNKKKSAVAKQILTHATSYLVTLGLKNKDFQDGLKIELVSKELNHFGVIAGLFRPIVGHSSRFVLFCSF